MTVISTKSESITLDQGEYIVIDALYLDDIRQYVIENNLIEISFPYIREMVFPYCLHPFASIKIKKKSLFSLSQLRSIREKEEDNPRAFATDTGLILFIKTKYFSECVRDFSYYKLVEKYPVDRAYWQKLCLKYPPNSLALILSPGINSGFDFEGSGIYEIKDLAKA